MKVCSDNKLQKERLKKCPKNRKYPPTKYLIQPYEDEDGYDIGEISYIAFSSYEENGYYAYVASDKEQTSLKLIQFSNGVGNVVAILKLNLDNTLSPFEETDWEDVSLGPCDTKTEKECIYIANTGSNNDDRDVLQILKIYEPDLANLDLSVEEPDVLVVDPITVNYSYGEGFNEKYNDAETLFVDWKGDKKGGKRGDIYIVTKRKDPYCDARVGKIPSSFHSNLSPGESTEIYSMSAVTGAPPQGNVKCEDDPYRPWTGGDMSRKGNLIALRREEGVYFYSRLEEISVVEALSESCPFAAPTSNGLPDENQFEAVGFVGKGNIYAETSECDNKSDCQVPVYFYNLNPKKKSTDYCWETITYDNFEKSSENNYKSGSEVERSDDDSDSKCNGNCACEGDYAMKLADNAGVESSFYHESGQDCSSYSHLRITFKFKWSNSEPMDSFFLELSLDDGNSYSFVSSWALDSDADGKFSENKECYEDFVVLDAEEFGMEFFTDEVKVRFRSSVNGGNDAVYIDEVAFEGGSSDSCDNSEEE